jgi:hypothetical protein
VPLNSRTISIRNNRTVSVYLLLLVSVIGLTAFSFVRGKAKQISVEKNQTSNAAAQETIAFQGNSSTTQPDAEHITLRATGFEPSELSRPAGRFLLSVDNRAEIGELQFRLLRENGSQERDLLARHHKFRLKNVVS